ncbi:MAG: hypothetical protein ABW067_09130 [Rhizobacter sp.]
MKVSHRVAVAALLLCGGVLSAQASGWVMLLKNTPAEVYDEEDLQLFLAAAGKAVAAEDSQVIDWSNPATGSGGSFKPLGAAPSVKGLPCKKVRMTVYAKKRPQKSARITACKTPENKWKLATVG